MRNNWISLLLSLSLAWVINAHAATSQDNITTATKSQEPASVPAASSEKKAVAANDDDEDTAVKKPAKILPSDVRVLIDVSGSMKQTDPQNLRKPAVDLIIRLLPDKSRAGIWTFGNDVNMLMPHRLVDQQWRQQAAPKTSAINSIALFTNIGKALDEVSFDQKNMSPDYKTHIILLTDGVVDIGKDTANNSKERQRIISEILPNLKKSGYVIHTIALSADADVALLKKLSVTTDGVFTTAVSADQLMSVFLKIFDQAVPADRVPLENNGFLVDASIKEFTALIFRKPSVDKTIIAAPDGKEYSATDIGDNVNWYHTDKYDLITADTPKAGQWKIKTEISPQSRITVVSDLQLVVEPLKNNLHPNDALPITYSFKENGATVTNKDFLTLLDANAIVAKIGTPKNFELSLTAMTPPEDGLYHQSVNTFAETGDYEVHVFVDGKTFKREFKHSLSVRDSLLVLEKNISTSADGIVTHNYKITTDEKIVDIKNTQLSESIKNSQNNNVYKSVDLVDGNHWEFSFTPTQSGDYRVDVRAKGQLLDGNGLDEKLNVDSFTYTPKVVVEKSSVAAVEPEKKEEPKAPEKPKEESSNLILYIALGIGNLLIVVLGYFAYRMLMGGKVKNEIEEIEQALEGKSKKEVNTVAPKTVGAGVSDKTSSSSHDELDKLFPLDSLDEPTNTDDKK